MGNLEKDRKHPDSLFGPNIGIVSSGPDWTNVYEKKVLSDELTQDVVKGWVEKSKDVSCCCISFLMFLYRSGH